MQGVSLKAGVVLDYSRSTKVKEKVLDFVQFGGAYGVRTRDLRLERAVS